MENVKVALKIRNIPTFENGISRSSTTSINSESIINADIPSSSILIRDPRAIKEPKQFTFDNVFNMDATQERFYNECIEPMIDSALLGFNICIFAYGQTNSGKTYTMHGPAIENQDSHNAVNRNDIGIVPRVANQIFKNSKSSNFNITVTYFEIYQENIKDLLQTSDNPPPLKIRMENIEGEKSSNSFRVEGLSQIPINSEESFNALLLLGGQKRTTKSTQMNLVSSRSHSVFTIHIEQNNSSISLIKSKIHLIDLAGSERADSTGATGVKLKEGAAINTSLSSLGKVINALATGATHIPYRDSKLTYILSDSLGGNSKTIMVACVVPTAAQYEETVSTLRFAERSKKIVNSARINMDPREKELQNLRNEVKRLKELLKKCKCGLANLADTAEQESKQKWWRKLCCCGPSNSGEIRESTNERSTTPSDPRVSKSKVYP